MMVYDTFAYYILFIFIIKQQYVLPICSLFINLCQWIIS